MRNLAMALISAASKFEVWNEEIVSQNEAYEALDQVKYILSECTEDEKELLTEVTEELAEVFRSMNENDEAKFCDNFMASINSIR